MKRSLFFFLLLVRCHAVYAVRAADQKEIEDKISRGELQAAAAELQDRIVQDSKNFSAHLLLGIVLQKQGRPDDALREFQRCQELRPGDPAAYVDMGNVLLLTGHPEAATKQFAAAIRVDPRSVSAHRNLGLLYFQQNRSSEAVAELSQAVKFDPADVASWFGLLQAHLEANDLPAARLAAAHVCTLAPASSELFRSVAALLASAGDYQGAIPILRRALEASPGAADVQYNFGLALLRNGEAVKALPLLLALRNKQDSAEIENLLAEAYETVGRSIDAVRAYQLAAQLDPKNEDYTYDYLNELLTHKSFQAALLVGEAAAENFPGSVRLQLALVAAHYGLGNVAQARTLLLETSNRFPESSLALYLRCVIAEAEGKPDPSLMAQTAHYLEKHPGDSTAWLVLGKTQVRQDPDQAVASIQRSLAIKEEAAEAHFELAKIYFDKSDWNSAAEQAKRAVKLNPRLSEAWYRLALASYRSGSKSVGDAAMQQFKLRHASDQNRSKITTFLYTLR